MNCGPSVLWTSKRSSASDVERASRLRFEDAAEWAVLPLRRRPPAPVAADSIPGSTSSIASGAGLVSCFRFRPAVESLSTDIASTCDMIDWLLVRPRVDPSMADDVTLAPRVRLVDRRPVWTGRRPSSGTISSLFCGVGSFSLPWRREPRLAREAPLGSRTISLGASSRIGLTGGGSTGPPLRDDVEPFHRVSLLGVVFRERDSCVGLTFAPGVDSNRKASVSTGF